MARALVLGTRGSALALWQARHVALRIEQAHPGLVLEQRVVATAGDLRPDLAVADLDERGIFVRALEQALLSGAIDLAVHSLKDLPTEQPAGLEIAAVLARDEARDALVTIAGLDLAALPAGARVGTGSPRRQCQLLHARPDLEVVPVRGNVDTRVERVRQGSLAAVVLALAGLQRLAVSGIGIRVLEPAQCVPAVGQGVLAVETRADDAATRALVAPLEDPATRAAVTAERACLRELGAGCLAPAAAHARVVGQGLAIEGLVGSLDGCCLLVERERGRADEALELGRRLADRLRTAGARRILDVARAQLSSGRS